MNKQECQICDGNFYLQDELGGKWIIENNVLIIKQRFQGMQAACGKKRLDRGKLIIVRCVVED